MTSLFHSAVLERYHVRFTGHADIEVLAIGGIEAVVAARQVLMARGVRRPETLASGRVSYVEAA